MSDLLALTNTLDNLIHGLRNLTESLNEARTAYLIPTPARRPQALVTSRYFTNARKRSRSPQWPSSRKRVRVSDEDSHATLIQTWYREVTFAVEIPVGTSSAILPKTPARRNKRDRKTRAKIVTSPYFTVKESAGSTKADPNTPKRRRQPVSIATDVLPVIDAPNLWWEADTVPADIQSVARYKRDSLLYYSLWLAKPILIQGTSSTLDD